MACKIFTWFRIYKVSQTAAERTCVILSRPSPEGTSSVLGSRQSSLFTISPSVSFGESLRTIKNIVSKDLLLNQITTYKWAYPSWVM